MRALWCWVRGFAYRRREWIMAAHDEKHPVEAIFDLIEVTQARWVHALGQFSRLPNARCLGGE